MFHDERILDETRITIERARYLLGSSDKPCHPFTVRRLIKRGELGALYLASKLFTSVEAVRRYVAKRNGLAEPAQEPPADRARRQQEESARTDRELRAAGIRREERAK